MKLLWWLAAPPGTPAGRPITARRSQPQTLQAAHVTNTADLVNVVPGLMMPTSRRIYTAAPSGFGITAIGPGIENSVALYVDGSIAVFPHPPILRE